MRKNPDFDLNMILILLLILSAYSEPVVPVSHNKDSKKDEEVIRKKMLSLEHFDNLHQNATLEEETYICNNVITGENKETSIINSDDDLNKSIEAVERNKNSDIQKSEGTQIFNKDIGLEENEEAQVLNKENDLLEKEDQDDNYDDIVIGLGDNDINNENDISEPYTNTQVIREYPNKLIKPDFIDNKLIVSVPVLLSMFEMEFDLDSNIRLDYPAEDINCIKNNMFLTECRLFPNINKLFLSGFIRKSVEYSAVDLYNENIESNIRHISMEIPFKCSTVVSYLNSPKVSFAGEQIELNVSIQEETNDRLLGKAYIESEKLTPKIYCRLIQSSINGLNLAEDITSNSGNYEKHFKSLTEKMSIKLTIGLFQEQQVKIDK